MLKCILGYVFIINQQYKIIIIKVKMKLVAHINSYSCLLFPLTLQEWLLSSPPNRNGSAEYENVKRANRLICGNSTKYNSRENEKDRVNLGINFWNYETYVMFVIRV